MSAIHTLLVANRGEIARRIIRTARELGLRTVAVYADDERSAPHVRDADVAVPLRGDTVAETYLDAAQLIEAAQWQGADAVHPGYGFLSESAPFARAVLDAGLRWVGPPPDVIAAMGDKWRAREAAEAAGLPVLPSAVLHGDGPSGWAEQVAAVGYPLVVKAVAGGGGRGMRLVRGRDELADAVVAAGREAAAAFGDSTVYAERWLEAPRHVEIQLVADAHGAVLHLGDRECSVQRRHQKLIEESPSPGIDDALRHEVAEAAVHLARTLGYQSLGTVELLVDDHGPEPAWWFLEVNARIQVEHPVTEARFGVDLVRLQLEIADGRPLPCTQQDLVPSGHAIEARVCAEDPVDGWAPSAGRVHRFAPGPTPGLRYDSGVASGATVSSAYDSLLVKVVAHAPDRGEATRRLVRGLRELAIHGPTTTVPYLIEALSSEAFAAGDTHTDFVDRHPPIPPDDDPYELERRLQRLNTVTGPHLAAAALVGQVERHSASPWSFAPSNWRNVGGADTDLSLQGHAWRLVDTPPGAASQSVSYLAGDERWELSYTRVHQDHPLERRRRAAGAGEPTGLFTVAVRGPAGNLTTLVEVERLDDGPISPGPSTWMLHVGRRGQQVQVCRVGDHWYVNSPLGQSDFVELPRFGRRTTTAAPGSLLAPLPGRVVAVLVAPGDDVSAGDELVVLEAMKVEHRLVAPRAGTVTEVRAAVGDAVEAHAELVRIDSRSDDEDAVEDTP